MFSLQWTWSLLLTKWYQTVQLMCEFKINTFKIKLYVHSDVALELYLFQYRLQTAISTALLEAVNTNNTQILLEFSHLFIGGKYFYKRNNSDVIVVVDITEENGLRFVSNYGNLTSEVIVYFHSDDLNGHTIQV